MRVSGPILWLVGFVSLGGWAVAKEALLFSPVSEVPEWRLLDSGQGQLTRQEFESRLQRTFDPGGALSSYLLWDAEGVTLFRDKARTQPLYRLTFAPVGSAPSAEAPHLTLGDA